MIQVPSEDLRILMESGYLYLAMLRYPEAKAVFEGVIALTPSSDVPWVALGNVYCMQEKYSEAIKHYQKALELQPQSAFAKAYLGESLFFKGEKEEALKVLEEAVAGDQEGKSGEFAKSLIELIQKGFVPKAAPLKK